MPFIHVEKIIFALFTVFIIVAAIWSIFHYVEHFYEIPDWVRNMTECFNV